MTPDEYLTACLPVYLETLVRSGFDGAEAGDDVDEVVPLADEYGVADIGPDVREDLATELVVFVRLNWADVQVLDPVEVGHDFAVSRTGLGPGFPDRGNEDLGERLHAAAEAFGEIDPTTLVPPMAAAVDRRLTNARAKLADVLTDLSALAENARTVPAREAHAEQANLISEAYRLVEKVLAERPPEH